MGITIQQRDATLFYARGEGSITLPITPVPATAPWSLAGHLVVRPCASMAVPRRIGPRAHVIWGIPDVCVISVGVGQTWTADALTVPVSFPTLAMTVTRLCVNMVYLTLVDVTVAAQSTTLTSSVLAMLATVLALSEMHRGTVCVHQDGVESIA